MTDKPKHPGGRPLKFKSVEELYQGIQNYFNSCYDYKRDMFGNRLVDKADPTHSKETPAYIMTKIRPFTVTGLALALDTYRDVLIDYESGKYDDPEKSEDDNKQFSNTIKKAKLAIYADTEEMLFSKGTATGAIFSLKNNYKWKDRSEIDNSGEIIHKYEDMTDEQLEAAIKSRKDRVS